MNDDFLRRLRPMPRAAFVHELKARLDRQPRTGSTSRGPAYLRTLLIALLIGGAAFAVTLLTMRRDSMVAHVSGPVSQAPRLADNAREVGTSAPAAKSKNGEVSPAITRAARGDSAPLAGEGASAQQERRAGEASTASSTPAAAEEPSSRIAAGIVIAGEGFGSIEGAGSAFPARIYKEWSTQYQARSKVSVSYLTIGAGGGLKLLEDRGFTFAGTETPLSGQALRASGLLQFPAVASGVVPVVRLDGVMPSQIKLDGSTLARIYLGEISRWNDPAIQGLNPGLGLPGTLITLVYRQDDSASTRLLTDYLARQSPAFKARYGVNAQIDVSPGAAVRGENAMLDLVNRTDGAIGYVDYLSARERGIESIRLVNKEGKAVSATRESLQSALTHADWVGTPGFGVSLTDLSGDETWPMTSASYVIVRINRSRAAAALLFFDWAYRNGAQTATQLGYVPIPPMVANRVRESWTAALIKGTPPPDSSQGK